MIKNALYFAIPDIMIIIALGTYSLGKYKIEILVKN